ncbi:class I poly(R)-hydroxyalkanoic acid synthase [Alteromonas pelagimontana]|uniref:Class I poly(R)-hydroxyalkanoic acid synthase n=1 Tax=Alteromonas pelagimontana TaxID=1858656 RepID=A0A6M4MD89_9ALTE|nr:class I poly(R)-hydroxyalkanoic acid synthase [Alteromonas pelagimontana]QJR80600.1 class I poly(R)-hydroxyalkanoic acid synthase [Alteromonas pelagimontana]
MKQQDEDDILDTLNKYAHQFNAMVQEVLSRRSDSADTEAMFDPEKLHSMLAGKVEVNSAKLIQNQMDFMRQQTELWQQATKAMLGEKAAAVVSEESNDRRFSHSDWQDNPVFSYLKQAYLINSKMLQGMIESMEFKDPKSAEQVKFYTRQYINSVSPTNYLLSNPEVCEEILKTKGQNMVKGIENFMHDLEQSPLEAFKITQTDMSAFALGENLATTKGEIIYQNPLMQLIHYAPKKVKTYATPILFVPPFINKYYILDLDENKSVVNGLLDQGHSVFMISWINPDASLAKHDFVSYMRLGPLAAMDVVTQITQQSKLNMVGFCVGGTLLGMTAAYLRAQGDERIASLTLLTTLLDFSEPGEVGNYLTEEALPIMERHAELKGIYDGRILGLSFSMLRENNLFWSYFINNYLKGKDPAPFDILFWNSDATNITAACFKQYIRTTYWEDKLKQPGGIQIDGVPIDLANIDMPVYFLSTLADHIVLWQGAYKGTQLVKGDTRFVLGGSGHLAGVITPPESGKYPHWVNAELPATASEWFDGATKKEGSWWPDWHQWLLSHGKQKTAAVKPGKHKDFPVIEAAPGSYARRQL